MYAPFIQRPLTFEEFLAWEDGSGRDFDLYDGFLMPYIEPTENHEDVADDLWQMLADHCKASELPYPPSQSKQVKVRNSPITNHERLEADKPIGFPKAPTVIAHELPASKYQAKRFRGGELIVAPTFSALKLTVNQVVGGGK